MEEAIRANPLAPCATFLQRFPLFPHSHPTDPMSSSSPSPNVSFSRFQDLFNAALREYNQKTGKDIATDPLTARLLPCNSPDAVLAVLQEQARAFNRFRKGDWKVKIMRRLEPIVDILFGLSTSGVFGEGIGLVRHQYRHPFREFTIHPTENSGSKSNICRCWSPTRGMYHFSHLPASAVLTLKSYRPLRASVPVMTHSSSFLNVLNITLAASKSSPTFLVLSEKYWSK